MKLESATSTIASVGGYATTIRSGPRSSGKGGSAADVATGVREEGVGMGGTGGEQAATRSNGASPAPYRERSMLARYTLTMTYAKPTLTLTRAFRRFVTLARHGPDYWKEPSE